jgi:hypothetical protein
MIQLRFKIHAIYVYVYALLCVKNHLVYLFVSVRVSRFHLLRCADVQH